MLNSPDGTAAALEREGVKPYVDPAFRPPHAYVKFPSSLHDRSLITWEQNLSSTCGLFFGAKKNGRQRLILDTCPQLQIWLGDQLAKEAAASKERRKAREERALAAKPPAK